MSYMTDKPLTFSIRSPRVLLAILTLFVVLPGCATLREYFQDPDDVVEQADEKAVEVARGKETSAASKAIAGIKRIPGTNHPDLNGIWQTINTANYNVERHLAAPALLTVEGPRGPVPHYKVLAMGAVGSVPGGLGVIKDGSLIPYKPEAAEKREENRANWADRDPEVKCYLPGVPRANYMPFPFQIVQGEDSFFIAYEYAGAVRDVFFDDPGEAPVDSWMGQSVGKWEGDTLVVTVTAQVDTTWFDRSGNHHSAAMVVTERWTPMGPNHIHYEATIDDPETFTEAWTIEMPLYRRMEENLILMDFKCVQFVEELLYGQWRRESVQPEE
jgi:hypothetical protein